MASLIAKAIRVAMTKAKKKSLVSQAGKCHDENFIPLVNVLHGKVLVGKVSHP